MTQPQEPCHVRPRQTSRRRFRNQTRSENRFRRDRRLSAALERGADLEASRRRLRQRQTHADFDALGAHPGLGQPDKSSRSAIRPSTPAPKASTTRPAFRGAWKAGRRCLVVADGYYEWRDADKQPFAVALGNRGPMTFAGLWDRWRAADGASLQIVRHHHHGSQRTPQAAARPHAGPACPGPLGGLARRTRLGEVPPPTPSSRPCSNPIPAGPWPFGRSTGALAMSERQSRSVRAGRRADLRRINGIPRHFARVIHGSCTADPGGLYRSTPARGRVSPRRVPLGTGDEGNPRRRVAAEHRGICSSYSFRRKSGRRLNVTAPKTAGRKFCGLPPALSAS